MGEISPDDAPGCSVDLDTNAVSQATETEASVPRDEDRTQPVVSDSPDVVDALRSTRTDLSPNTNTVSDRSLVSITSYDSSLTESKEVNISYSLQESESDIEEHSKDVSLRSTPAEKPDEDGIGDLGVLDSVEESEPSEPVGKEELDSKKTAVEIIADQSDCEND
jgi:hypothetical protein